MMNKEHVSVPRNSMYDVFSHRLDSTQLTCRDSTHGCRDSVKILKLWVRETFKQNKVLDRKTVKDRQTNKPDPRIGKWYPGTVEIVYVDLVCKTVHKPINRWVCKSSLIQIPRSDTPFNCTGLNCTGFCTGFAIRDVIRFYAKCWPFQKAASPSSQEIIRQHALNHTRCRM